VILKTLLADQEITLNVPQTLLDQATAFFDKMDADMDKGWQVNREWVEQPNAYLRGQIAADKLLTALENEDNKLGRLMAGYILSRFPHIDSLELSEQGEIRDHILNLPQSDAVAPADINKLVSGVFKMGKQYRFSIFNNATEQWEQSPAFADKDDAEKARQYEIMQRLTELS
jgi:hypothetical protein